MDPYQIMELLQLWGFGLSLMGFVGSFLFLGKPDYIMGTKDEELWGIRVSALTEPKKGLVVFWGVLTVGFGLLAVNAFFSLIFTHPLPVVLSVGAFIILLIANCATVSKRKRNYYVKQKNTVALNQLLLIQEANNRIRTADTFVVNTTGITISSDGSTETLNFKDYGLYELEDDAHEPSFLLRVLGTYYLQQCGKTFALVDVTYAIVGGGPAGRYTGTIYGSGFTQRMELREDNNAVLVPQSYRFKRCKPIK